MPELQDIFQLYGKAYRKQYNLPYHKFKTMQAIENCRTSAMGGHIDVCDECGFTKISYNSCKNRHCPKCQTFTKEKWIAARQEDLLNIGYFHVVFTLPDSLNEIIYQNQETVYALMFKAVSETLMELAADKKYLGAKVGITTILHTWGQNLNYHPHIHCVVPGGGLDKYDKWINSRKKFFIPVKVLSRKFRGKFIAFLQSAKLNFYGSVKEFRNPILFNSFLNSQRNKEWIVYCKPPFGNASKVVEYLGRYTHRVAISNNRILSVGDNKVTFRWRDYRDNNKHKTMTLSANEFIRRFLMHVLPSGFTKIRHYGLMSSRTKSLKLKLCKKLTNTPVFEKAKEKLPTLDLLKRMIGKDFNICPSCGVGHLGRIGEQLPKATTSLSRASPYSVIA